MGIFVHMAISKSVKKQEWEQVYEETLPLVKAFSLAENRWKVCKGINTMCLVPTEERQETWGWNDEYIRKGWFATGDYNTMRTAELYFLPRDLVEDNKVEPDAGDPLYSFLPTYFDYNYEDPKFNHIYNVWGSKTQGEPYHIYLLAIACLIESRLGTKAFVHGDITWGQCKKAVALANQHLTKPIDVPDRCDLERFRKRVANLPISESEKFTVFEKLYLGTKDANFGEYIRNMYPKEILEQYWRKTFNNCHIDSIGFSQKIKTYFLWGFELDKLCKIVNYGDDMSQYEIFAKKILDAKLHVKEKNCKDFLEIDQTESQPYSIYTLFAQFAFGNARNPKVNRYIPIDEIRNILNRELKDKCNVNLIIEEYLKKEAEISDNPSLTDEADIFQITMDVLNQRLTKQHEKYNIVDYEALIYYKKGDTISPELLKALKESFMFYANLTAEEHFQKLMDVSAKERCEWLVKQNRALLIRDKDWNRIFTDIEEHEESFKRYYPMVRIRLEHTDLVYLIDAIILNDEFYEYCQELINV